MGTCPSDYGRYQWIADVNSTNPCIDQADLTRVQHYALKEADLATIMTEWDEFRRLKAKDYIAQMPNPVLVDARRIYNPLEFRELKFAGVGFGS